MGRTSVAKRWSKSWTVVRRFLVYRGGATLIEYAVLIALIIIGLRYAASAISS